MFKISVSDAVLLKYAVIPTLSLMFVRDIAVSVISTMIVEMINKVIAMTEVAAIESQILRKKLVMPDLISLLVTLKFISAMLIY
jgi:hypothetical protein